MHHRRIRSDQVSALVISVCYRSDTAGRRQVPSAGGTTQSNVHIVPLVYGQRRLIRVTGALVITAGVALVLVRFFGDEMRRNGNLESVVGAVAFGAVIAAPECWRFCAA